MRCEEIEYSRQRQISPKVDERREEKQSALAKEDGDELPEIPRQVLQQVCAKAREGVWINLLALSVGDGIRIVP